MKKFIVSLIFIFLLISSCNIVFAEDEVLENDNVLDESLEIVDKTVIVDFVYYPLVSIDSLSNIRVVFKTNKAFSTLKIYLDDSNKEENVLLFYYEKYLEEKEEILKGKEGSKDHEEDPYEVEFVEVSIPVDDPNTEIDETEGKLYVYRLDFKINSKKTGIISLIYDYSIVDEETEETKNYVNAFYLSLIKTNPVILYDDGLIKVTETRIAVAVCLLATVAEVLGTFLIISGTNKKKMSDDEENEGRLL